MIWLFHFFTINLLLLLSKKLKKDTIFIAGTFLYSIIVFGQRWMTGEDFPGYLLYYITNFNGFEQGFFALQNFLSNHNIYFGVFIFIIYSITLYNFFKFIIRLNNNRLLIIYIFVFTEIYFIQMSQIRQLLAISFFVQAYYFLFNKRYFLVALNFFIALSIHLSVLLMIPLLFLKIKFNKKILFLIGVICILLPFFNIKWFLGLSYFNLYSHYIGSVYDVSLSFFHYLKYYAILGVFFMYIITIKKKTLSSIDLLILNGTVFYFILYGISFQFAPMIRVSNYLKIFEFIFFIYYLTGLKYYYAKFLKLIVLIMYLLFYLAIALKDPYNITRYEFKLLHLYENRTYNELRLEINDFYEE